MICTECNKEVRPIVAVDIDGTTADYYRHFFTFAGGWLGVVDLGAGLSTVENWVHNYHGDISIAEFMGLDKRTYRQIKLAYRQGGMKRSMPLMPFAKELFLLLRELDTEIWVTTTRPYLQLGNVDDDTREWLQRNELPYDYIVYDDHKYQRLSEQVDPARVVAVLEDQHDDWMDAALCNLKPVMVRTRYNYLDQGMRAIGMTNMTDGLEEAKTMLIKRVDAWRRDNGNASD